MEAAERRVFQKTIRNWRLLFSPRELHIHRLVDQVQVNCAPFTAKLLGHQRGWFSTVLDIERLDGPESRWKDLGDVGPLLARIERETCQFLRQKKVSIPRRLDFYASAGHRSRRYDIATIVQEYGAREAPRFAEFKEIVEACAAAVERAEPRLMEADKAICHLDHLPKNFIRQEGRLFLIDWGEGYVGRIGFDAGCYLMVLLRAHHVPQFRREASSFIQSYRRHAGDIPADYLLGAMNRIFLPRSLWYLLRPDIITRFESNGRMAQWREKLDLLKSFAEARSLREFEVVPGTNA
jgi:hypothetical protein